MPTPAKPPNTARSSAHPRAMTPAPPPPPPPKGPGPTDRREGDASRVAPGATSPAAGAGAPSSSRPRKRRGPIRWVREASTALSMAMGEAYEALAAPWAARRIHDFADLLVTAREPDQVEMALVRIAGELANACRVELLLDRDEQTNPSPKQLALWPEAAAAMTPRQVESLGYPLCLGLRCGAHYQMTLQVYARPGQLRGGRWSNRVVRRLTTLAAMASAAERGLHVSQRGRLEVSGEMAASVRDATFLNAILPYALGQASRHREQLTVLCLEIDDLAGLQRHHGRDAIDQAVIRMAESVARTLRGSDVVARLDDDRVVVMLPNTGGADALKVANVVRGAIAGACLPQAGLPALTVSMGVAYYPADGRNMFHLLHAADDAATRARARGTNQTQTASFVPPPPTPDAGSEPAEEAADPSRTITVEAPAQSSPKLLKVPGAATDALVT